MRLSPLRPTPAIMTALLGGGGVTYYVDATSGSDSNDGLSAAAAWQTGAQVNSASLDPGDRVLFKRGETWTLTAAVALQNGVYYGTYGSGAKPILDGTDTYNVFYTQTRSGITLEDLDLRNGYDFCAYFEDCTDITVTNCDMNRVGNDCLNFFGACANCTVTGGVFQAAYARTVGPSPSCIEMADGAHDIVIDGVECHSATGTGSAGLTIHSHTGTAMPYNVTVRNANIHDNDELGLLIFNQNDTAGAGENLAITVEDCQINDNTLDGIRVTKAAAITEYPSDITFTDIVCDGNGRYAIWNEGDEVTYNRVLCVNGRGISVRDSQAVKLYHVTVYLSVYAGFRPITIDSAGTNRTDGVDVRNAIIQVDGATTAQLIGTTASNTTNVTINYVLYYMPNGTGSMRWTWAGTVYTSLAAWQSASGQDANSPAVADPLFVAVATDFTLQVGSPAIDVGVVLSGYNDGYLGNAPDVGYAEKA